MIWYDLVVHARAKVCHDRARTQHVYTSAQKFCSFLRTTVPQYFHTEILSKLGTAAAFSKYLLWNLPAKNFLHLSRPWTAITFYLLQLNCFCKMLDLVNFEFFSGNILSKEVSVAPTVINWTLKVEILFLKVHPKELVKIMIALITIRKAVRINETLKKGTTKF